VGDVQFKTVIVRVTREVVVRNAEQIVDFINRAGNCFIQVSSNRYISEIIARSGGPHRVIRRLARPSVDDLRGE
jgi:hypothetical protein